MNDIVKNLKDLVNRSVDPQLFPVIKGKKILVGTHKITETDQGFRVKDKDNKFLAETRTKAGAVAVARTKKSIHPEIQRLDYLIDKNIKDCVFYKNFKENSKDSEIAEMRLNDSRTRIKDARQKLENFIFTKAK